MENIDKKNEYQNKQIPEYWIFDPENNKLFILNLVNCKYNFNEFNDNQIIIYQTFPHLKLTVKQILLSDNNIDNRS